MISESPPVLERTADSVYHLSHCLLTSLHVVGRARDLLISVPDHCPLQQLLLRYHCHPVSAYYDLIFPYMEMKIEVVWSHFKVFWLNKDDSTRHSDRKKKKEVDRRGGKTILKCGQEWTLPGLLGQLKTELHVGGKWLL